jgi:hypothetical protein
LYSQYFKLQWKTSRSDQWVDVPLDNLRVAPSGQTCLERYFGMYCNQYCELDCGEKGLCGFDETGTAVCQCIENFYGPHCESICDPKTNCSGHGRCDNGQCICDIYHSGQHCEQGCSRDGTCNGHGDCDGDGACKCDVNWTGNTCAQHKYMESPIEAPHGSNYTLYNDEYFSLPVVGPVVIPNCSMAYTTALSWQGAELDGAIVVSDRVTGKLRIHAKPIAQITIFNQSSPPELGPPYSCWGTTITASETREVELIPNKLYPFYIQFRSGCEYIDQWVKIEWMLGQSDQWQDVPQDNLRVPEPGETCLERYFGDNCDQYCDADCNMHGNCVLVGNVSTCECFPGWTGPNCQDPAVPKGVDAVALVLEDREVAAAYLSGGVAGIAAAVAVVAIIVWRVTQRQGKEPVITAQGSVL